MTEKLKQTIKEEVAKLPRENQEAINALDWAIIAEEIGKKYLLNGDEVNNLQMETMLVLIGLEDPNFYALNIEDNVGTNKDEAEKIAEEVLQKIFIPITSTGIENIKKSGKTKNSNPEQTLNFILSGGDYSSFMTPTPEGVGIPTPDAPSRDIEKEKTNIPARSAFSTADAGGPIKPGKMDDIKSKFVI